MITVNIAGGLGNQLFQYAAARSLNLKSGKNVKLILDVSFFENIQSFDTHRDFKLGEFNIKIDAISHIKSYRILRLIYRMVLRPFSSDIQIIIFKFLIKLNIPVYLTRNFQKEKYFMEIRKVLLSELTLKNKLSVDAEKTKNDIEKDISVSLHVRRSDYVKMNNVYGDCSITYYQKSVEVIKNKFNNAVFYIFSDDIEWVKQNLKILSDCIYVSSVTMKDYEELILMSKCKHNIIANSTFSWWGAWLNQNNDKIVIAPKYWFKNKTSNEIGVLPEKWIQLKNN